MPVERVDWNAIKGALADVNAPYVFIIPDGARQLLLSIADKLSWRATYRGLGYDYSDWDELQALQSAGVAGLLGGIPLSQLIEYIDDIEDLLRGMQALQQITVQCCDNLGPANEQVETDLEPGGTPPGTWGDEPVSDLEDWEQLVCGAAHAYVDFLKNSANEIETFVELGVLAVGGVAALLSILAGAGILLTISYGTAATVVSALVAGATVGLFGSVAADLEAARADIVCEIVHGDVAGFSAAIEAAISPLAWSTFFQFIDYASARNVMLEGSHGEETLGVNRRDDCVCAPGDFFMAQYVPVNGECHPWRGAAFVESEWGDEQSVFAFVETDVIRLQGAVGTPARLAFSVSEEIDGTPIELFDVTIDVVGLSGNVLVQTFINSGTAIHNQNHDVSEFPLQFSGVNGIRLENNGLANNQPDNQYAEVQFSSIGS